MTEKKKIGRPFGRRKGIKIYLTADLCDRLNLAHNAIGKDAIARINQLLEDEDEVLEGEL